MARPTDKVDIHPDSIQAKVKKIEGREWWLWLFAIIVTLALTVGLASFTISGYSPKDSEYWIELRDWVRGLAALVLIFDLYTIYQHLQLYRTRRLMAEQNELFRLISENAADMIALADASGRPLYSSPAYERVLGYAPRATNDIWPLEQVHPDDRKRVLEAVERTRTTGIEQRLEYRIQHQDGTWRILESATNSIRNTRGEIEKVVIVNRDITQRKRAEELLEHNSLHDVLTNLPNRASILQRVQRAIARSRRHEEYKFAVLYLGIEGLKLVNDSLGHGVGEELLVQLGQSLAGSLRGIPSAMRDDPLAEMEYPPQDDLLAKLPGDEFAILLDDLRGPSDAIRVGERIQERLNAPFKVGGQEIVISASIGVAMGSRSQAEAVDVLRDAEIAMHRAKDGGKARCEVFGAAMHADAVKRLHLETEIRKGIERNEFKVFYQPIVSLDSGRIAGFEALTRWQRPEGLVMPAEFLGVAEETGLILGINRMLIREACRNVRRWQEQGPLPTPLRMCVNVTPKQFSLPTLVSEVDRVLRETGLDPASLELEMVETIAMGNPEKAGQILSELTQLGVRLSIDDFGTGYSSLGRLQGLPVSTLKIDRAFVSNMETDSGSREIVRVVTTLAHSMGLTVIAEGVETEQQAKQVCEFGCDMAQGYYYSRPMDEDAIGDLLAVNHRFVRSAVAQ